MVKLPILFEITPLQTIWNMVLNYRELAQTNRKAGTFYESERSKVRRGIYR